MITQESKRIYYAVFSILLLLLTAFWRVCTRREDFGHRDDFVSSKETYANLQDAKAKKRSYYPYLTVNTKIEEQTLIDDFNKNTVHQIQINRLKRYRKVCNLLSKSTLYPNFNSIIPSLDMFNLFSFNDDLTHQLRPIPDNVHSRKDEKRKILMCAAPKSGTSNWITAGLAISWNKTIAATSSRLKKFKDIYGILPRYEYTIRKSKHRSHYVWPTENKTHFDLFQNLADHLFVKNLTFKFINARHPLARLESCYRDKFTFWRTGDHDASIFWFKRKFHKICTKYEDKFSLSLKSEDQGCSFVAFLRFVTDKDEKTGQMVNIDKHWTPISWQCSACLIEYDAITKIETIDEDFAYLLDKLNFEKIGEFKKAYSSTHMNYTNTASTNAYLQNLLLLYEDVPTSLIRKIYDIYMWDFQIFGYEIEPFLKSELSEKSAHGN